MHRRDNVIAALAAVVCVSLTGCDPAARASHHQSGKVLTQAQGICPTQIVYGKTPPPVCLTARDWNALSHVFNTPHRPWGVAYAYNCGSRAGDFSFVARLPGMDHMGFPGKDLHGTHGSGYVTYSAKQMKTLLTEIPQQFKIDGGVIEIAIASPCTWHVTAVLGSPQEVASAVPPIPAVEHPWWK